MLNALSSMFVAVQFRRSRNSTKWIQHPTIKLPLTVHQAQGEGQLLFHRDGRAEGNPGWLDSFAADIVFPGIKESPLLKQIPESSMPGEEWSDDDSPWIVTLNRNLSWVGPNDDRIASTPGFIVEAYAIDKEVWSHLEQGQT